MADNLRTKIESNLKQVYCNLGISDKSIVKRKIKAQFKMLTGEKEKQLMLNDGDILTCKILFIAYDERNDGSTIVRRDNEIFRRRKERYLTMIITDTNAYTAIEEFDSFTPCEGSGVCEQIRDNGVWNVIDVDSLKTTDAKWLTLY